MINRFCDYFHSFILHIACFSEKHPPGMLPKLVRESSLSDTHLQNISSKHDLSQAHPNKLSSSVDHSSQPLSNNSSAHNKIQINIKILQSGKADDNRSTSDMSVSSRKTPSRQINTRMSGFTLPHALSIIRDVSDLLVVTPPDSNSPTLLQPPAGSTSYEGNDNLNPSNDDQHELDVMQNISDAYDNDSAKFAPSKGAVEILDNQVTPHSTLAPSKLSNKRKRKKSKDSRSVENENEMFNQQIKDGLLFQ